MKQLLWLMLVAMPFSGNSQNNSNESGIQWAEGLTWDQVKKKAKNENKFIFVDAYTTWCGPCKKMDAEVYPKEIVGKVLNSQFVSVKVQMDQTSKDNEEIKNWYSVAKQLHKQYSIEAYPSFLFFNPDGKLVHKAIGLKDVAGFIELAKDALTDPEERYEKSMAKFDNGTLDYEFMGDLALQVRSKNEKQKAAEIAKVFKEKYLDKLPDDEAFQRQHLKVLLYFVAQLLNSGDRYFKLFYKHPDLADSILGDKQSRSITLFIIRKDEVLDNIYKDGKPITTSRPNWKSYERSIEKKYGKKYVNKIFPDDQIAYYRIAGDWKHYVKYVNLKIKKIPPQANSNGFGAAGDAHTLNSYAWALFQNCKDEKYLNKAFTWVNLAIKLDTSTYNADYYDTKANLLYRLGKVKEALELEEFAVIRSKSNKEIVENLRKMKEGLPTWPIKNNQ